MIHPLAAPAEADAAQLGGADLVPGQLMAERKVLLDAARFAGFAAVSGDAHPLHDDAAYACAHGFRAPLAHGLLLVAISALGATTLSPRMHDAMIAMLDVQARFIAPAFVGDTLTVLLRAGEVVRKSGNRCVARFDVELLGPAGPVATLEHRYLLRFQLDERAAA
jgi:3-hydroxybutyryl-CoA dehydratase